MRKAVESGDDFSSALKDPPTAFLRPQPRKPMSRRSRLIWILVTVVFTTLTAVAGIATMQYIDRRAGIFVVSTAPVIALLVIYVSGIWRQNSA